MDLYLLHQPYKDVIGAWRALEEAKEEGKIRSIGIIKQTPDIMKKFLPDMHILPAVNQVELNPLYQQKELRAFMKECGILAEAWFPLEHGDKGLLTNPVLVALAEKYQKNVGQIILRWHMQEGIVALPKATTKAHIEGNLADEKDVDGQGELFLEDGVLEFQMGFDGEVSTISCRTAIVEAFRNTVCPVKNVYHINGQQVLTYYSSEQAEGTAYCEATLVDDKDGKEIINTNYVRYTDHYVKADGKWYLKKRRTTFLFSESRICFPNRYLRSLPKNMKSPRCRSF